MPGSDAVTDAILCNQGYVVGYSGHYKAPLWVAYRLTAASVTPDNGRSNDFREDTRLLASARTTLPDFKHSGFDRWHMAPRAAMDTTPELGSDSFLLSNMAAQSPGFNRGDRPWITFTTSSRS
jgi:endonuclease G